MPVICLREMLIAALLSGLIGFSPQEVPGRSAVTNVPKASAIQMAQAPETLSGKATWYDYREGHAAAGSELRDFLGRNWRGQTVRACHQGACVSVVLTDWCGCPGKRVIDLDDRDFNTISDTSAGVITITISR